MANQLFGTNGVRGLLGDTMVPEFAHNLGRAVGTWCEVGSTIAVGRDARDSGPELQEAFMAGIRSTGVHTVDLGILASPGIQLYVRDKGYSAGGIITASHNPPEYNGIKLVAPDGTETSQDQEAAVEAIYFAGSFRESPSGNHSTDGGAAQHYVSAVLSQVDVDAIRSMDFKVALDPGGGAGCIAAPMLLDALEVDVIPISCELDGAFSDRPSEPTLENAGTCIQAVNEHGAHMGVLQDGDADRAVFITDNGEYVWGDTSLALAAKHELVRYSKDKRLMCTAVSSGSCVSDVVQEVGGTLRWTVVGSPVVARDMIDNGAVFGGEDNGGLMFSRHQYCRDGLMAMAFMLELMAKSGKSLSELVSEIPSYALVKDKLKVSESKKQATLEAFKEALANEIGINEVDDRDGVKAYLDNGWVLVRPSGTEAIFRIQGEAENAADAEALVARFKAVLESILQ